MLTDDTRAADTREFRPSFCLFRGTLRRRTTMTLLLALAAVALLAYPMDRGRFFLPGKVRVLVFSGRNNHDWRASTPFLRSLLLESGRFDVRVCEDHPGRPRRHLRPTTCSSSTTAGRAGTTSRRKR